MNEKFKEIFTPFVVKVLGITAHNCMCVPVHDEEFGAMGLIIFANKHVEKEYKNFDKKDEKLADLCSSIAQVFFKIKSAEMYSKAIEDKNWRMSELVDKALASSNMKVNSPSFIL